MVGVNSMRLPSQKATLFLHRSAKPFKFSEKVAPICLPPLPASVKAGSDSSSSSPLWGKNGYVAGWGLTRNEDCFTDNYGPSRHSRCRFPFFAQGKITYWATFVIHKANFQLHPVRMLSLFIV